MKKLAISLATLMLPMFVFASTASAAEFIMPSEGQQDVTVALGETHKNLYIVGNNVRVSGPTMGDLYAAGGKVFIEATVEQDLFIGAGDVTLNFGVGGDVKIGGGNVHINGPIGGDLIVAGGTVTISNTSVIAGDLIMAGGTLELNAPVVGTTRIVGEKVVINSKLEKEVKIEAQELRFGPSAVVFAKVNYKGQSEAVKDTGAQVENLQFEKIEKRDGVSKHFAGIATLGFVLKLLASFIVIFLLSKLFPKTTSDLVATMVAKPWVNLGIGFLALVVTPIASIFLLFLFVGYMIAFVAFLAYIVLLVMAMFGAALFAGSLLIKLLTKKPDYPLDWQAIAIGVVALAILKFIPVLGWLACLGLFLIAFGAMVRGIKSRIDGEMENKAVAVENN